MSTTTTPSKIYMAYQIHEAMSFLGIPASEFLNLRKQYGSVENLYTEMENRLTGNK